MADETEHPRRATAGVYDSSPDAGDEDAPKPKLDPEVEARRAAALSFVRKFGDPVLKSRATRVDRFDDALRSQVARMAGLMKDAIGVGLAAPPLGVSQRLFVYRLGPGAPPTGGAKPARAYFGAGRDGRGGGGPSIAR